ncbi:MAG: hypothetical protein K8R87_05145 [Verrucomicrobia bacterium]|nr:hypothetical protein [Verrucomicrobiota bacterium]
MFRRVVTDSWHDWASYAAFAITFLVFIVAFVRTILMRKDRIDHIARLPLDDGAPIAKSNTRNP